jgi:hypothetical protein
MDKRDPRQLADSPAGVAKRYWEELHDVGQGSNLAKLTAVLVSTGGTLVYGQVLPFEPAHDSGQSITGAFEGWFKNSDGSFGLLLGYYNRNQKQELDIPIGPNNRIEPGGPDRGQPTHFLVGRQWGMFTIKVPADFGEKKIIWTIVASGKATVIPASLKTDYEISPFIEAAVGNTPPVLSFEEKGPSIQGPQGMTAQRMAKIGPPLTLTVWVSDDAKLTTSSGARPKNLGPPVTLRWSKYRGPGQVRFSKAEPDVEAVKSTNADTGFSGKATTTVLLSEPGQYVLHVVANDYSGEGGGGFQCCWTNGEVNVSVF